MLCQTASEADAICIIVRFVSADSLSRFFDTARVFWLVLRPFRKTLHQRRHRETLQRDGTIFQMREEEFGDIDIVIDYLGFGELRSGIEKLVEVRDGYASSPNG